MQEHRMPSGAGRESGFWWQKAGRFTGKQEAVAGRGRKAGCFTGTGEPGNSLVPIDSETSEAEFQGQPEQRQVGGRQGLNQANKNNNKTPKKKPPRWEF